MNSILLYIFTVLLPVYQVDTTTTTRTYKFEHASETNKLLTDHIQLVFKNESVIKGTYYGNDFGHQFVADIKFDKERKNSNSLFTLINYRFCRENSDPFEKDKFYKIEKVPFELEHEEAITFRGAISNTKLDLRRTLLCYDSRSDQMQFTLEKEE